MKRPAAQSRYGAATVTRTRLEEAYPIADRYESGVVAERVESGVGFDKQQFEPAILKGLVQPLEAGISAAQRQMDQCEREGRNITSV